MNTPIITVSGLRGIVGQTLTPDVALRFTCAFSSTLGDGSVVVTRDGRQTGPMLADTVHVAMCAMGRTCWDAGVASTPTCGQLVRELYAAGGIQVSASHNPPQYNGIKLFSSAGRILPAASAAQVLQRYESRDPVSWAGFDAVGASHAVERPLDGHLQKVLDCVDVSRIQARGFRVLLDANHGAGAGLGKMLFEALGCQTTLLGPEPDGRFTHPPEPTEQNLADVIDHVSKAGCDVGFCQDPDADRLAIIDANGRYIGEEYTLALCADHVLSQTSGPVVTNCSSSRMVEEIARRHGTLFYAAPVGEANVVDVMLRRDAVLGGEGNGGVIDPRVGLVRDSFLAAALILDLMAARKQSIRQLVADLPQYEIVKTKASLVAERLDDALDALQQAFSDAVASRPDGLRLDWNDRWMLIRPSNTEPIVRIIAEGPTRAEASRLCRDAQDILARFDASS